MSFLLTLKQAIGEVFKIRALATVPGIIAISIWIFSILLLIADRSLQVHLPDFLLTSWFWMNNGTAESVLSVISGAAITTLGLVYSLVLIVFTLAAGNIGPRLLQRFNSDRVNQITAGLLGATFLVSLTVLHQSSEIFVPVISVNFSFLLAVLSLLQLIFFVQSVSRSVMIDEEVAEISRRLEYKLSLIVQNAEEQSNKVSKSITQKDSMQIESAENGYLTIVEEETICALACEHDLEVKLLKKIGTFVLKDQTFITVISAKKLDDETRKSIDEQILECVVLSKSRSSVDDIEYAINVLIEIALRALSPGVNDTFTAISCIDRLTGALNSSVQCGLTEQSIVDNEGCVRLQIPGYTANSLIDSVFHPLRRSAASNLLMLIKLADALSRLHEITDSKLDDLLQAHGRLLYNSYASSTPLPQDLEHLKTHLDFVDIKD
ncbi:MAG: DUF2254 domain-containing protein [Alphaproteobacteria bacterium]|nr:DUF2254 domain-containing protein [Alphaproteobacteria bacterium]